MKLAQAQTIADALVAAMTPYCVIVKVAGSVRRQSPEVKDIEIVAIPKWEDRPNPATMFGEPVTMNLLFEILQNYPFVTWIKPGTSVIEPWPIKADGKYWRGLIARGAFGAPTNIKLDLFLARPENFGVIYTIRTGSSDFSRELMTYARNKTNYRVQGGELVAFNGQPMRCASEATLFAALNLKWITPPKRRGYSDLVPVEN